MINCDFEKVKKKFAEYWAMENSVPLMCVYAPKDGARWDNAPSAPERMADRWTDAEYVIKRSRCYFNNTAYFGGAFPNVFANLGPDIFGAILGCGIEFGSDTSWAVHKAKDMTELQPIKFDPADAWFKKMTALTEALLKDAKGDYYVGANDYHTGFDALVSLIGPEQLCMDLLSEPDIVKERLKECETAYSEVFKREDALLKKYQAGYSNWMSLYSEKKFYVTSCDFSCLISPEMFNEYAAPYLNREIDNLDRSIYHLDGKDALRHIDTLLSWKRLNGIQWVYGAGQPTARFWIPLLKKIQSAGKLIEITVEKDDIKSLLENLSPKGLLLRCYVSTESEARDICAFAEKAAPHK